MIPYTASKYSHRSSCGSLASAFGFGFAFCEENTCSAAAVLLSHKRALTPVDCLSKIEWNCNGIHIDLCASSLCRITVKSPASMGTSATGNSSHSSSAIWVGLRLLSPYFPVLLIIVSTVPFGIVDLWNCFHFGLQKKSSGFGIARYALVVLNHQLTLFVSKSSKKNIANWNFKYGNWDSLRTPCRALRPFCLLGWLLSCTIVGTSIARFVPNPLSTLYWHLLNPELLGSSRWSYLHLPTSHWPMLYSIGLSNGGPITWDALSCIWIRIPHVIVCCRGFFFSTFTFNHWNVPHCCHGTCHVWACTGPVQTWAWCGIWMWRWWVSHIWFTLPHSKENTIGTFLGEHAISLLSIHVGVANESAIAHQTISDTVDVLFQHFFSVRRLRGFRQVVPQVVTCRKLIVRIMHCRRLGRC